MNIKTIKEEFYKEFGHIYAIKNEMSGNSYNQIFNFFESQLHKAFEEITEGKNWMMCSDCKQELNENINNFFK